MKYKCENELNTLEFKDFNADTVKFEKDKLFILTNGGIARYNNSCNETLEERYISESEISFLNCTIDKFYIEGAKYFNPDDVLIKEVPDKMIDANEYKESFAKLEGGVIYFISGKFDAEGFSGEIAIDVEEDTYWLNISCKKVIVGFDRFMNRVMQ